MFRREAFSSSRTSDEYTKQHVWTLLKVVEGRQMLTFALFGLSLCPLARTLDISHSNSIRTRRVGDDLRAVQNVVVRHGRGWRNPLLKPLDCRWSVAVVGLGWRGAERCGVAGGRWSLRGGQAWRSRLI